MKSNHFISHLQHEQIVEAIRKTERRTTGEVHVFVSHMTASDPLAAARMQFESMGMHRTPGRNAVLIFVAPRSRTFAVIGDQAVHQRVGDATWQTLVATMAEHFRNEKYMAAIVHGIERAGELLAEHFPRPSRD